MDFFTYFTEREIAGAILIATILLWGIFKSREILMSFVQILKHILFSKIIIWYISSILTVAITSLFLIKIGFWEKNFIKDALIFAMTGFALMHKIYQAESYKKYIKETLLTFFTVSYLFQFIFNYASYSIVSEIILSVTALIFGGMKFVIDHPLYQKEFEGKDMKPVNKVIDSVLVLVGCLIILKSLLAIVDNSPAFLSIYNAKLICLPLIYSIFYIPFSFIFWLVLNGESTYMRLNYLKNKATNFKIYLKFRTFLLCGLDINKTNVWIDFIQIQEKQPTTKEDVNNLVKNYKIKTKVLPFTDKTIGYNPYVALNLLKEVGLGCKYYRYLQYSTGYGCYGASSFKRVGQVDTIEYYISGNQEAVQQLYLKYCNNRLCFDESHLEDFMTYANILFNKVFNKNIPSKLDKAVRNGNSLKFNQKDYEVIVETERFNNNKIIDTKLKIRLINPVEYSEFEIKNILIT